jgi:hypothetical protein
MISIRDALIARDIPSANIHYECSDPIVTGLRSRDLYTVVSVTSDSDDSLICGSNGHDGNIEFESGIPSLRTYTPCRFSFAVATRDAMNCADAGCLT